MVAAVAQPESAVTLLPYQMRWVKDRSRFKMGIWSRQSGKSFGSSLEVVDDAVETGDRWVLLSAGERQSKELMEKCKLHCEAMQLAASDVEEDFFEDTRCKQLTIHLSNGGRIIGLPANPDTARGFSANVLLDEFAFHKDSDKIWTALYPTITRGFKLRIVTTPQGKSNMAYRIWTGDNGFSKHFVDIYTAVKEGLPVDPEELRKGIDDADAWQQEYECLFLDEATAFLTYELIAACESDQAMVDAEPEPGGEYYMGVDIGRRKDLTILWIDQKVGDVYWTRRVDALEKMPFREQEATIASRIREFNIRRVCIDETGIGAQLAENTQRDFGDYRVERVTFTNPVKNDLAVRTKRTFEDRRTRVPLDQKIREDLHSVKKTTTAAGNQRFDAERTKDGHADRFWAKSLCLMATDQGGLPMIYC